ncbi:MAG: DNA-binding protein WhiA, partial [Clostridia bacterium]|nr:DNA-binding protein WhiA [Clostridia bacterium]
GTGYVVYIRRSEMITNLLTLMGLSDRSLQLIETTIVKSVKNNINRARNCDNANISKTVEASIKQRKAIEFLEKTGRLEVLPEQLFSAARLRMENPEASLNELCKLSNEPITVSGLNHRLQRIIEIYEELQ